MNENQINNKANNIRDVIKYLKKFKNSLLIIYIDDSIINSSLIESHIKDIGLLHEAGIKIILIPGASHRINQVLKEANITWKIKDGVRITDQKAMPLIKMTAFDVSNQLMTVLAGEKITGVIGNWVRARGKGVINGIDFGSSGEIDKLQLEAIRTILDNNFIPIFPCIGWSLSGKPYNISSILLAEQIAEHFKANKLFYILKDFTLSKSMFNIPTELKLNENNTITDLNLDELNSFLQTNDKFSSLNITSDKLVLRQKILNLLLLSKKAIQNGVSRIHILNGSLDGCIPCELFSTKGLGTMIYKSDYCCIRKMKKNDIFNVLALMKPFIEKGILLNRSYEDLEKNLDYFIVYEIEDSIKACSSLIPYPNNAFEIAAVAVDESFSNMGIGPKMISYLIKKAKDQLAKKIFLLTTQTSDWFESLGFKEVSLELLPKERLLKTNLNRKSKVLLLENL